MTGPTGPTIGLLRRQLNRPAARADDPRHAWNRVHAGWSIGFWLFLVLAVIEVGQNGGLGGQGRALALTAVGALGLAYLGCGPTPARVLERHNAAYLALAIVAAGLGIRADPALSLLLFILYPQMWIFSGDTRSGAGATLALTVAAGAGFVAAAGLSWQSLAAIGPTLVVSLAASVLMGVWISRIIDQSRERAELIEQLEAARHRLGEAHHAAGVMAERERVAQEIHDTLAQGFTSIVMLAQAARVQVGDEHPAAGRLDTIEATARENLSEARALVAAFGPVGLNDTTLVDAVGRLARRFETETGVAVEVSGAGELGTLSRNQEVVLLRAAQEALTNVRRHAGARSVTIRLAAAAGAARVEVVDDGVGFAASTPAGFGLSGMRDRVLAVGGELDVTSAPGAGTRVSARIPVSRPTAPLSAE